MRTTMNIVAAFSLAAVASADFAGYAQVINACSEEIFFQDVPAANDLGYGIKSGSMKTGENHTRHWAALATGGFSIKMSPKDIDENAHDGIVQYEWNMDAPPTLWWDMSNVNDADNTTLPVWTAYSSDPSCSATFKSYVYPTDDTAMQASCDSTDVVMTVMLCSDSDAAPGLVSKFNLGDSSTPAPTSSSEESTPTSTSSVAEATPTSVYVAPTTSAEASSTPASTEKTTSAAAATSYGHHWTPVQKEVVQASPTTLATSAAPVTSAAAVPSPATTEAPDANVVWVTDVQTAFETQNVVQTVVVDADGNVSEKKHRRHAHGHPHGRKH